MIHHLSLVTKRGSSFVDESVNGRVVLECFLRDVVRF